MLIRNLSQPIPNPSFRKYFLISSVLLAGLLIVFINPTKLDASDFLQIAWNPGQELLTTGSISINYPYPVWTALVMLPFSIWQPQTAMVLWVISNLLMLAGSLAILILIFFQEISLLKFTLIGSLYGYFLPVLTSMWLGQLTIFLLLDLVLITYFFIHRRWTKLGVMLGFSFVKPQVMILLVALVLISALWQRRWKIILGFSGVMLLLTVISIPFITSPVQLLGGGIGFHLTTYLQNTSTIWGVLLSLGIPVYVPLTFSIALSVWLVAIWLPSLRTKLIHSDRVLFLFSAAILVNLIVIPYSWMHNLTLLILPIGYTTCLAIKLKSKARIAWLVNLFVIMYPITLALFIALIESDQTQAYQIIPAMVLLPAMWYLEHKEELN